MDPRIGAFRRKSAIGAGLLGDGSGGVKGAASRARKYRFLEPVSGAAPSESLLNISSFGASALRRLRSGAEPARRLASEGIWGCV